MTDAGAAIAGDEPGEGAVWDGRPSASRPAVARPVTMRHAWIALAFVSLAQGVSLLDRQVLAILAPAIKADLGIRDADLGLLYGTSFAVFYAVFALPMGRLADGCNRTRLLSVCIAGWSLMTGMAAFAQNFAVLALTRVGVAVGEAGVQPAGLSLLSDAFPRERRGMVTAVASAGGALGLGGAMWLGGAVADSWNAYFPPGAEPLGLTGWQAAFLVAAIPGLVLAFMALLLKEPERGASEGISAAKDERAFSDARLILMQVLPGLAWVYLARIGAPLRAWLVNTGAAIAIVVVMLLLTGLTDRIQPSDTVLVDLGSIALDSNDVQWLVVGIGIYVLVSWAQMLRFRDAPAHGILLRTPSLMALFVIAALGMAISYGVMGWTASYLILHFDSPASDVGLVLGLVTATTGLLSPLLVAVTSDRAKARHPSGRLFLVLGSFVFGPICAYFAYTAQTLQGFYAAFALTSLIITMWLPPLLATLLDLVLPRMRGTVMSIYMLSMTITGLGIGPFAVGLMSDITGDLGGSILNIFWLCPILAVITIAVIRRLPKDEATVVERARKLGEPA